MALGRGKIKESDKHNSNGFDKNKQNINTKGQPRKSFSTINNQLKEKGVEPLTKTQFIEAYTLIFNATDKELKVISNDLNVPLVFRLIIKELSNTKTRSKALADYRDYMFGRSDNRLDITTKGESLNYRPIFGELDSVFENDKTDDSK